MPPPTLKSPPASTQVTPGLAHVVSATAHVATAVSAVPPERSSAAAKPNLSIRSSRLAMSSQPTPVIPKRSEEPAFCRFES